MSERMELQPGEFEQVLAQVRRNRAKGRQRIELSTPTEVIKATELGIISKAEARALFGLKKRRAPARRKVAP